MSLSYYYIQDAIEVGTVEVPDYCPADVLVSVGTGHIYNIIDVYGFYECVYSKCTFIVNEDIHAYCFIQKFGLGRLMGSGNTRKLVLANSKILFGENDILNQDHLSNLEFLTFVVIKRYSKSQTKTHFAYIRKDETSFSVNEILYCLEFKDIDMLINSGIECCKKTRISHRIREQYMFYQEIRERLGFSGYIRHWNYVDPYATYYPPPNGYDEMKVSLTNHIQYFKKGILKKYKSEWMMWKFVFFPKK